MTNDLVRLREEMDRASEAYAVLSHVNVYNKTAAEMAVLDVESERARQKYLAAYAAYHSAVNAEANSPYNNQLA